MAPYSWHISPQQLYSNLKFRHKVNPHQEYKCLGRFILSRGIIFVGRLRLIFLLLSLDHRWTLIFVIKVEAGLLELLAMVFIQPVILLTPSIIVSLTHLIIIFLNHSIKILPSPSIKIALLIL